MKKLLHELVTKTWQMESAKEKLQAGKAYRIDTMWTHLNSDCEVALVSGYNVPKNFICSVELTPFSLQPVLEIY